jgi:hypothetical protein
LQAIQPVELRDALRLLHPFAGVRRVDVFEAGEHEQSLNRRVIAHIALSIRVRHSAVVIPSGVAFTTPASSA